MGKYFGTDGFRGEANVNLTVEHAYKVGRFLGWYYGREHKAQVVIGKDTRRSSYMFEYSLVAGLTASGADVYLLHVTTTPSVSYVVRTEGLESRSSTETATSWKQMWSRRSRIILMARPKRSHLQPEKISDAPWTFLQAVTATSVI